MIKQTQEQIDKLKSLQEMIESCFTYGGADENSYNYEKYIKPYENQMDKDLFKWAYREHLRNLKENYSVKHNVYTDAEGLNYSTLIKN
jgi:hypothetical protein